MRISDWSSDVCSSDLLAAIGVAILAASALNTLWISLALAGSFAFYGLIRKLSPVTALQGLAAETLILTPFSLLYLAGLGSAAAFASASLATNGLLALSGVITSVPLLLFAVAAKRLRYSDLGRSGEDMFEIQSLMVTSYGV